jgi:uncharacterized lipoprotein YddW (UPF0748 family)
MILGVLGALCCAYFQQNEPNMTEPPLREFRAAWVATVENIDWPSKPGLPVEQQKSELLAILDKAAQVHLNAIVLQVRPTADAFYASRYEPWSGYLTGTQGLAPNPPYDPLAFAVSEAHRRGIELHAWINPFRAKLPSYKGAMAKSHVSNAQPSWVKTYGQFLWLDPGSSEARQHSLNVILDIVKRYDIDGIHIDDYFYPYHQKDPKTKLDLPFPDETSYQAYQKRGGKLELNAWRRQNVNRFVQAMYEQSKGAKPWVKVGISPFGIYRPGYPPTVKAGFDQYTAIYADPLFWLEQGWCDYMAPQLYWKIEGPQSFPELLKWWSEHNPKDRYVWPGIYAGRTFAWNKDWPAQEIVDQITKTREMTKAPGQIHFSFNTFLKNPKSINELLVSRPYASLALVPETKNAPVKPVDPPQSVVRNADSVSWSSAAGSKVRFYAIYLKIDVAWRLYRVVDTEQSSSKIDPFAEGVGVTTINVYGQESKRVVAP